MSSNKKRPIESDSEGDDDDNESIGSLKEFIVDVAEDTTKLPEEELIDLLKEEASEFTKNGLKSTVIGGRSLRSRDPDSMEQRKPKDMYYERFGKQEEEKLMEKFTKKDIIEYIKTLQAEYKTAYEEAGNTWPSLNTKMSLEAIQEKYQHLKAFIGLPDSDDEDDEDDIIDEDDDDDIMDDEDDNKDDDEEMSSEEDSTDE
jgi:hypothetical protein